MITVWNRKVLIQDTDAQNVAAVWSKLRECKIKYEVVTKTHTSSFKRMLTQKQNIHFNMGGVPATWTEHPADYLYIVYVHKNDYNRAKELCNI
ncbi:MAG: hypothetical protein E7520_05710 [Ruminococcaceae bacterium]|nr:hypothetical protein [Oscillospiraceae bacterium]